MMEAALERQRVDVLSSLHYKCRYFTTFISASFYLDWLPAYRWEISLEFADCLISHLHVHRVERKGRTSQPSVHV